MSNPNRIKVLGDGIDDSWAERRMSVLYDGARAKFEQNLSLQEELLIIMVNNSMRRQPTGTLDAALDMNPSIGN